MLRTTHSGQLGSREAGNAILMVLLILSLLLALATAQFAVAQKNLKGSNYFLAYEQLHEYAESGISLALHDLQYKLSGNGGKIGTVNWTTANDVGSDGTAGTADEGEGDGIPTAGEPNVAPVAVGSAELNAGLTVYVANTAFANVQRVVATVRNSDAAATVSTFVQKTVISVPKVGAVYVDPNVALDLKGNAFIIDGNDHNPDGSAGSGPAVPGIATAIGSPAGTNKVLLLSQIPPKSYNQIKGSGGSPSLAEAGGVDVNTMFQDFKKLKTQDLAPGTYPSPTIGTTSSMQVTYVSGDLQLAGKGQGAGVLLVEGSVTITGQFDFDGLVIVLGDVRLSGGGAGVHVYGSVLVGQSITAIDKDGSDLTVAGTADVFYSSAMLQQLESSLSDSYSVVYYDDM